MAITLYQYKSGFGVPCPSPFCMKAEILLKMTGQPYRSEIIDDPRKSPKGKLPFIDDDGTPVADSELIRWHLETRFGTDFDEGLTDGERAQSHAFCRMMEERLYWAMAYDRWEDDAGWKTTNAFWFSGMPPVIRTLLPVIARRQTRANLKGHGLGLHDASDIYAFAARDIAALATQLGDKPFMFGDRPTAIDAIAYPTITNLLIPEYPGPLLEAARAHPRLQAYSERCQALWFPELA
ncbi:glutathione S-transferase family protein [Pacificimonas sp. WHA3]|uniref:Glutathione S-transferase family protein n=1 Tax=Pacificimonas pallii TaxID=2827236 RepID=A0ABS6SDP7_9SPHN|nr:glutathione S-transferase family protein [Pacificimonas pallii]MBV7256218.1 glutathione S-transferase family protein [Pacificimonas pallii]